MRGTQFWTPKYGNKDGDPLIEACLLHLCSSTQCSKRLAAVSQRKKTITEQAQECGQFTSLLKLLHMSETGIHLGISLKNYLEPSLTARGLRRACHPSGASSGIEAAAECVLSVVRIGGRAGQGL